MSEDYDELPDEILSAATNARDALLPQKSRDKYNEVYSAFENWQKAKGCLQVSETVLLAYFEELSKKYKPSSMWTQYSMLKSKIRINEKIDIGMYTELSMFLKKKSEGFKSKKSKVFRPDEIHRFLTEAPDLEFLATKVIMIFGICGSCKTDELVKLSIDDITDYQGILKVKLTEVKSNSPRSFVIGDEFYEYVKKYVALRPKNVTTDRFFLNYQRGKCTVQVIGKNKFHSTPKKIADYLNLSERELYTGHSFRRTSAVLFANRSMNVMATKRQSEWTSPDFAEVYVDDPLAYKQEMDDQMMYSNSPIEDETDYPEPWKRMRFDDSVNVGASTSKQDDSNGHSDPVEYPLDHANIDTVLDIYKSIAKLPVLSAARITSIMRQGMTIQSTWSQRNLVRKTKQKFTQDISLDPEFNPLVESFPVDITTELASCSTEDETQKAIFRQTTVDNTQKVFIEIWDRTGMIKFYDLSVYDVHGDVYTDAEFASFQWSPDKTRLLYIAEKKPPKCEPFYKQKNVEKAEKEGESEHVSRGTEYVYKPHWGEQLVGKHHSTIVVLNIEDDTIKPMSFIPNEYFPGQAIWTPNGEYIVGICWKRETRYFGLYACTNRPSWVFLLRGTDFIIISPNGYAVRSPRFSPDGKTLIYYQRTTTTPHHNAHRLRCIKWETDDQIQTTIEMTADHQVIEGGKKFYGLYGRNLPQRCFSVDSKFIFLSTPQRNVIKSYIVNLETNAITEIQSDGSSMIVLDVKKNRILFLKTSLTKPSQLVMGRFDPTATDLGNLNMMNITTPLPIPGLDDLMYEHNEYEYKTNEEIRNFNFTYFGKKGGDEHSTPLIVIPHGGPHSCFANNFSIEMAVYALLGFSIVVVNYRGSVGMGSNNVEYLQGRVGEIDVLDCVTATRETLKKYVWLDPEKVCIVGASHGGFLAAHLTGNYPDLFKVAVLLNPVIDIPSMLTTTDIPDWCAAVTGSPFLETLPPTVKETKYAEIFLKMYNHSPILFADKVKAPSLICLGTNDLRVPYAQGKLWYHRLLANKVKTKLLMYEDNHSLSSDPVEMDHIINSSLWLLENVTDKKEAEEVTVKSEPTEEVTAE